MTEVVHADIFFFITAIAVIVVGTGGAIALYYLINILRDVQVIVQKARKASDELEQDFEDLRANVRNGGTRFKVLLEQVLGAIARMMPKARVRKKEKEPAPEEGRDASERN